MKAKTMSDISAKEFGELQSDVKYLKGQSDKQENKLDAIGEKLDSSLSAEDLQRFLEPIIANQATHNTQIADHETRLKNLEDIEKLRKSSLWNRILVAVESNFIKWTAGGLLIALLSLGFMLIVQSRELPVQVIEKTIKVQE